MSIARGTREKGEVLAEAYQAIQNENYRKAAALVELARQMGGSPLYFRTLDGK